MYKIKFTNTAIKSLKKIDKTDQKRILDQIEELGVDPLQKSNVKKLTNSPHLRLRVGNYRVIFDKDDYIKVIAVIDILHRKNAYRRNY